MSTTTANLGLTLPTPNVDTGWGSTINTDLTLVDNLFASDGSGTSIGIQVGSGKNLVIGGSLILGSGDATNTVTAPTIRGAARTGTNAVGANLTIDAPNGTGTGGSGSIIFRTAPPAAAGSTANTMQNVLEIKNDGTVTLGATVFVPSGTVVSYAGTTEPSGWFFCYGQAISRATYAALFAAIGTTYGAGDGSTTFNLPDLRGRAVAGRDDMGGSSANRLNNIASTTLGGAGGSQTHTLVLSETPAHRHYAASVGGGTSGTLSGSNYIDYSRSYSSNASYTLGGTSIDATLGYTGAQGGNGAHNNIQPTFILNYIIKT